MNLPSYLNKRVRLTLANELIIRGLVIGATKEDLDLLDVNNKRVSISEKFILLVEELEIKEEISKNLIKIDKMSGQTESAKALTELKEYFKRVLEDLDK